MLTTIAFDVDHARKGTTLGFLFSASAGDLYCRGEIASAQSKGIRGAPSIPTPCFLRVGRSGTRFSRAPLVGEPRTPKRESGSRAPLWNSEMRVYFAVSWTRWRSTEIKRTQ
jgi:hypothetical protein